MEPSLIDKVYVNAKAILADQELNADNMIKLAISLMEFVEKLKGLSGSEKKAVVITVVKRLVDDTDLSPEVNAQLDMIIDAVLPGIIDTIVAASRGKYHLNTLKQKIGKCLLCRS